MTEYKTKSPGTHKETHKSSNITCKLSTSSNVTPVAYVVGRQGERGKKRVTWDEGGIVLTPTPLY